MKHVCWEGGGPGTSDNDKRTRGPWGIRYHGEAGHHRTWTEGRGCRDDGPPDGCGRETAVNHPDRRDETWRNQNFQPRRREVPLPALPCLFKKQMTDQPVARQLLSCASGHQLGSGQRWSQADGPGHPEGPQGTTHTLLDRVTHWPTMKPTHLARLLGGAWPLLPTGSRRKTHFSVRRVQSLALFLPPPPQNCGQGFSSLRKSRNLG